MPVLEGEKMVNVRNYKVEISKLTEKDGGGYMAHMPELDCYGDGDTVEEAIADVYEVAEDLVAIAMEDGKEIPLPMYFKDLDEFSGKLSIRLPKTLHRQLSQRAKLEECSINQLIATYVSMGIGDAFGRAEGLSLKEENFGRAAMALSMVAQDMWDLPRQRKYGPGKSGIAILNKGVVLNEKEI